jgi:hypothetical protein
MMVVAVVCVCVCVCVCACVCVCVCACVCVCVRVRHMVDQAWFVRSTALVKRVRMHCQQVRSEDCGTARFYVSSCDDTTQRPSCLRARTPRSVSEGVTDKNATRHLE